MADMKFKAVNQAIAQLVAGGLVVVVDDEKREAEGDLVGLAAKATAASVNFVTRYARGLLCAPLTFEYAKRLQLAPMVSHNTEPFHTAFTVSVDAKTTTTGISANDRAKTLTKLATATSQPTDFFRPGHIFPLVAKAGGVIERAGHTEAAVDLAKIARQAPVAYICEIMNDDGTMMRYPQLKQFSKKHNLPIITIKELIAYRLAHKELGMNLAQANPVITLPTKWGKFNGQYFGEGNLALWRGEWQADEAVLVRLHSACATGDIFGSLRCDCGAQLQAALKMISQQGGILVYLSQEGRGIGLAAKLRTYALQEAGLDTVQANIALGFAPDERNYQRAAAILAQLHVGKVRLLTNNPDKVSQLSQAGVKVTQTVPLEIPANNYDKQYLQVKHDYFHHTLTQFD